MWPVMNNLDVNVSDRPVQRMIALKIVVPAGGIPRNLMETGREEGAVHPGTKARLVFSLVVRTCPTYYALSAHEFLIQLCLCCVNRSAEKRTKSSRRVSAGSPEGDKKTPAEGEGKKATETSQQMKGNLGLQQRSSALTNGLTAIFSLFGRPSNDANWRSLHTPGQAEAYARPDNRQVLAGLSAAGLGGLKKVHQWPHQQGQQPQHRHHREGALCREHCQGPGIALPINHDGK